HGATRYHGGDRVRSTLSRVWTLHHPLTWRWSSTTDTSRVVATNSRSSPSTAFCYAARDVTDFHQPRESRSARGARARPLAATRLAAPPHRRVHLDRAGLGDPAG